ncbi:hypothetical protein [Sphingomonas jatrophae]|uniref:Uncharacterized protein n=1 Tax=Sphingomonas jatrophae TaxID=1166337 RepID=A0A1I6JL62_9SPHN|nr:hypothetical protein [Sphingomonas jatrophae]SFR79661.1 hypothetical protein SAMN05192580_0430 [Sphingomonas jatrophae]
MIRARPSHQPGCSCPRCRHVRRDTRSAAVLLAIYVAAGAIGCGLATVFPPETTIPGFGVPADLPR